MQSFENVAELAKICANQARLTTNKEVASALWTMARNYQQRAAQLDSGRLPDIGSSPDLLK